MFTVVNEDYKANFSKAIEAFFKYLRENFYVSMKVKELSDSFIKYISPFDFESSESDLYIKLQMIYSFIN